MIKDKFGLTEMEAVISLRKRPHLPTVGAVLTALGIPNTVKRDIEEVCNGCKSKISEGRGAINDLNSASAKDTTETLTQIAALKTGLSQREDERNITIVGHLIDIAAEDREIKRVERLGHLAEKMS